MLSTPIDVSGSYATFWREAAYTQRHAGLQVWKTVDDLERYRKVIEATRPDVLVETGTKWGGSAAWFADELGVKVVTVDVEHAKGRPPSWPGVTFWTGDSVAATTLNFVRQAVAGQRVMVSLDSDHHAPHVVAEIGAYGPLVTPGCYLVVEDGLADLVDADEARRFGARIPELGGPLEAVDRCLVGNPNWDRDLDIEGLTELSHHPGGWWRRRG